MELQPPDNDELEVSVFGPGYGEALAVHIGTGLWILIDSCLHPVSRKPQSQHYLEQIGVDLANAVKLIVITHWHDDHIRGASELVRQCQRARVVISGALRNEEFGQLLGLHDKTLSSTDSGVKEFTKVFSILEDDPRRLPLRAVHNDQTLLQQEILLSGSTISTGVWSLSPSDKAILRASLAFAAQSQKNSSIRVSNISPNEASVAVWMTVGENHLLLGADLESSSRPDMGWNAVLDFSALVLSKASFFKLPHHGAASGHEDRVWQRLLQPQPFAATTPFRQSSLPTTLDRVRIRDLTQNAYITAKSDNRKPNFSNKIIQNKLREITKDIRITNPGWGHLRFRRQIQNHDKEWSVEMFGDASKL